MPQDSILSLNGLDHLLNKLDEKFDKKVDIVSGKGLSTNDYTTDEKTKLAGIASGANKYSLPTASSSTLGGVKTTSTVTSNSGHIACPIIDGVPYYKDTNTIYSPVTTSANGLMSSTDKANLNTVMSTLTLATCSTARNVTAKVATLANFVLKPGATIVVEFTDTTTTNPSSGNLTLNVNNTGAKTIAFTRNGVIGALNYTRAGAFYNNIAHVFTYNGTYWVCLSYNADNNTWTAFKGATASANGTAGYIPAPTKGSQDKFFRADGTWAIPSSSSAGHGFKIDSTEPSDQVTDDEWLKEY